MKRVADFTEPAITEAVKAEIKECAVREHSFSDQTGKDLEPAVRTICGHYIGENCVQQWTGTFAVIENQEDVDCPMCRTKLIIGQYPPVIRGAIWTFVECSYAEPILDHEADKFLLNAAKDGTRQCCGPELGVMLAKLSARIKVVESLFFGIPDCAMRRDQNINGQS
ncbi:hypothetical protein G6011_03467 [Alternaria panax]|uniref:RING-type domain-containing protein n=1 Tax=Alternaria panax TaxID=48097 RepID=A0AAD4NSW2_9PLEO|nr:hypothetical protein G6011_03467 [Alternaria panax]